MRFYLCLIGCAALLLFDLQVSAFTADTNTDTEIVLHYNTKFLVFSSLECQRKFDFQLFL